MNKPFLVFVGIVLLGLFLWYGQSPDSPEPERSADVDQQEERAGAPRLDVAPASTNPGEVVREEQGTSATQKPPEETIRLSGQVTCAFNGEEVTAVVELMDGKAVLQECSTTNGKPFEFKIKRGEVLGLRIKDQTLAAGYLGWWNDDIYTHGKEWPPHVVQIGETADLPGSKMTLNLPAFQPSGIEGSVESEGGRPIANASVRIVLSMKNVDRVRVEWILTDELGHFSFLKLQPGTISMKINFGQVEDVVLKKLMPPRPEDFQLLEGEMKTLGPLYAVVGDKRITGRVVDQYGKPFVGLEIVAQQADGSHGSSVSQGLTDDDGSYVLEGLVAGEFRVSHTQSSYGAGAGLPPEEMIVGWWNHWVPANLKAGVATLDLGVEVVQRPEIYSVTLLYPVGPDMDYYPKVKVQKDLEVKARIKEAQKIGNYKFHAYDFQTAPPWFNYAPDVQIQSEKGILKIICRLPHAPIKVELHAQPQGRQWFKPSELILMPAQNSLSEVSLEKPTPR